MRLTTVLLSVFWALLSYGFLGLHLWSLIRDRGGDTVGVLLLCVGTMGVAMLAGLFFFLLPSGAGVRDLVIVTAISPSVGVGPAVAYAALSRAFVTVADL